MQRRQFFHQLPFLGAAWAEPPQTPPARSLTDRLLTAIQKIEVVNTHEHILPEKERTASPVDFFTLASHYAINDVISAGLDRAATDLVNNPQAPMADRWNAFEPFWKYARFTGYGQALRIAIRDIYGVSEISGATLGRINDAIRARNKPGLYRYVLKERSHIKFSVLNDNWNLTPARTDPEFFVLARKFDRFVQPWSREDLNGLEKTTGASITSLKTLLAAMEREFEVDLEIGMVAVKTTLAYERELLFREVSEADAERDFERMARGAETLPVGFRRRVERPFRNMEDYIFHHVLKLADAHNVPVQVHTGITANNGNFLSNSNPTHLTNLFLLYTRVRFDLFHMSYPYQGELSVLAKLFPNVFADFCWAHIVAPEAARRAIHDFLDTVPINKIFAFGGDYRFPELTYGHLQMARRNIALALADRVQSGFCTEDEAVEIAAMMLRDNPAKLFSPRAKG